ncbi:MAG: aminoglycoside phosphotransferase family protein [Chloroflexota bacterium]
MTEPTTAATEVTEAAQAWPWPFSRADITAGLRRHLGDNTIQVLDIQPLKLRYLRPSIGRVRGLRAEYHGGHGPRTIRLVVKEPRGATRTGLAGAGRREVGVYHSLAAQLPLPTPALIAAAPAGDWLLLEALQPVRDAGEWLAEDYRTAIDALGSLHDRFWDLGEDLDAFPWLSRPIDADFEVHVAAAAQAIERIVAEGQPAPLAAIPERMQVLARLTTLAELVADPLRDVPRTFLHGDYWPGNIAVLKNRSQVVYDWQLAGVGPGVIDLLVFLTKSEWWFGELPMNRDEIVGLYRSNLAERLGVVWPDEAWQQLWDHALMWRFLQEWVDLLAATPGPILETRAEQLDRIWLYPVTQAVRRRLGMGGPRG